MKILLYILVIFNLILISPLSQQSITWQRVYPDAPGMMDSHGRGIQPADGGNFYFINQGGGEFRTQIIKINPYGDTIWTRVIDSVVSRQGVASGDGGYVFTGDVRDIFTVKINSQGYVIWKKIYGHLAINVENMIRTQDNKFAICGREYYNSGLIALVDSTGNLIWLYGYPDIYYKIYLSICTALNGGYLAAGRVSESETGPDYAVITRVDESGSLIWEKNYNLYGITRFTTIHKVADGYILTPSTVLDSTIQKRRAGLIKIDTAGKVIFAKILPDTDMKRQIFYISDLNITNSNRYILCGSSIDTSIIVNAKVIITDSIGNVLKTGSFSETDCSFVSGYSISNNDFVFIGSSDYFFPGMFSNTYVVRTDTNFICPPIGIKSVLSTIPESFKLYQNYPNPFNPVTKINYELPIACYVKLGVYDILGREISVLVNERKTTGKYEAEWNASNLATGIYFCTFSIDDKIIKSIKMILLK